MSVSTPPTFSVLIGTKLRPSLKDSLESIARQTRVAGDQCLVGIDAYEQSRDDVRRAVETVHSYGPGFLAVPYVGVADEEKVIPPPWSRQSPDPEVVPAGQPYHWLGVEQINQILRCHLVIGSHVFTIGDDDVFVDGAYETLRAICAEDSRRPVLYRFLSPWRALLWDQPRMRSCQISGCCIAAPYRYVDLMHTRIETTHDFDWMDAILRRAKVEDGKDPIYLDWVGVIARPDAYGHDVMHRGVWHCACGRWGYYEQGIPVACPSCQEAIDTRARVVEAVAG